FTLCILLELSRASVRQVSFGREGSDGDHGYELMKKHRSFDDFANGAHESASAWNYIDKKADESYGHANSWNKEARKSGVHRHTAGSNSDFGTKDYGRGFFYTV
ncbi:hypothetical protein OSTOST_01071, partial [Ostertagia ostertagi]